MCHACVYSHCLSHLSQVSDAKHWYAQGTNQIKLPLFPTKNCWLWYGKFMLFVSNRQKNQVLILLSWHQSKRHRLIIRSTVPCLSSEYAIQQKSIFPLSPSRLAPRRAASIATSIEGLEDTRRLRMRRRRWCRKGRRGPRRSRPATRASRWRAPTTPRWPPAGAPAPAPSPPG